MSELNKLTNNTIGIPCWISTISVVQREREKKPNKQTKKRRTKVKLKKKNRHIDTSQVTMYPKIEKNIYCV